MMGESSMKKTVSLAALLLVTSVGYATTALDKAILKSDTAQVQKELSQMETLAEQDKAILYELANDVLEKRNVKMLINNDMHHAANDFKRFTRSGLISFMGLALMCGSVAAGMVGAEVRLHPAISGTTILGGLGIGGLVAIKGVRDFFKSLTLDIEAKKAKHKKMLKKYTNAILVKQHILKA